MVTDITICGWAGAVCDSNYFLVSCTDAVTDPSNYDGAIFIPASLPQILDSLLVFIFLQLQEIRG